LWPAKIVVWHVFMSYRMHTRYDHFIDPLNTATALEHAAVSEVFTNYLIDRETV